ncbi:MAG: hypothetical protein ACFE0O_13165 [Opitutales bacterium]
MTAGRFGFRTVVAGFLMVAGAGVLSLEAAEVRALIWKTMPDTRYFIGTGERLVPIQPISPQYKSGLFAVPETGNTPLQLFEQPPGAEAPLPVETLAVNEVRLPLILILPGGSFPGVTRTRAVVLEDDQSAFPFGAYHFANLTRQELFVELGDARQRIGGGEHKMIRPDEDDLSNMGIRIAYREQEGARFVASSIVLHRPDNRSLLLFYPDDGPRGPTIRFKAVSEFVSEFERTVASARD